MIKWNRLTFIIFDEPNCIPPDKDERDGMYRNVTPISVPKGMDFDPRAKSWEYPYKPSARHHYILKIAKGKCKDNILRNNILNYTRNQNEKGTWGIC